MLESSPATDYLRAIESEFIRLRVTPLLFSPDDYLVARAWFEGGIPLALVLTSLADSIAGQREKGQDVRRRLKYYRRLVAAAWQGQQDLQAPAQTEKATEPDTASILERLAGELTSYPKIATEIRRLKDRQNVEPALRKLDAKLADVAFAGLPPSSKERIESEIRESVQVLGRRLPAKNLADLEISLRRQIVRRQLELPLLSVYDGIE